MSDDIIRLQGRFEEMGPARYSVENGVETREYQAVLVAAGRIRNADGSPGRYEVTADAIRSAVDSGMFEARAAFVDHAGAMSSPSLRDMFGVWHSTYYDEARQAAVGTLRVFQTETTRPVVQLLDGIMAQPDEMRPDVGVSIVFYPVTEKAGADRPTRVVSLRSVESADVVFLPAVEKSRILAALAAEDVEDELVDENDEAQPADTAETVSVITDLDEEMTDMSEIKIEQGAPVEASAEKGNEWLNALQNAGAKALIQASGLPAVVQERLGKQQYGSPVDVETAIAEARAELAALQEGSVVQIGGRAPRGGHNISVGDPMDEARNHINWFFGSTDKAEASAPPINMRRFDQLYVALTGDVEFRGIFDQARVMFNGATTATLPNLAADALNKVILEQMIRMDQYRWFERIVNVVPNDGTLNDMKYITMGGITNLPTVAEGGAYTELGVLDTKETSSFVKRGGYVGITREIIKNSNVMQLQAIPRGLANAALRTRSAAVSNIFTANSGVGPTLAQDNKALFHNDHKNLATTAFGTDATAWRAARLECYKHTELNSGAKLAIYPRFLLIPEDLHDAALVVLGYGEGMPTVYTPEAVDRGMYDSRVVPITVPDWTDATDWAYIVDPAMFPVIHMSYSQAPGGGSHPAPEVFAVTGETSGLMFTNDTLPIKVRDEFTVGVNGPRGIGKRNVAG